MEQNSMKGERAHSAQNGQRQHADSLIRRPSTGPSAEPRQLRQIASDVKSTLGDKKQVSDRQVFRACEPGNRPEVLRARVACCTCAHASGARCHRRKSPSLRCSYMCRCGRSPRLAGSLSIFLASSSALGT